MLFKTITIGGKDYKARLTTRGAVELDEKLGYSLLEAIGGAANANYFEITATVLHAALQKFHHGIDTEQAYDLLDQYVDDGGTLESMLGEIVLPILEVSGFFKLPPMEEDQEAKEAVEKITKMPAPKKYKTNPTE